MPDVGFMLLCKAAQQQEQLNQAATIIQAHYRRYAAQKQFQQLRQAASTIQQHATRFLQRREAAQEREREERAKRFKAVMTRHHERIQQLELEKQRLRDLPIGQLDAYEGKRHAAAIIIQAHWRGSKQREAVRAKHSGLVSSARRGGTWIRAIMQKGASSMPCAVTRLGTLGTVAHGNLSCC
eukprot:GHUV01051495.1.p1 GENE.GHUV01051495.1~~GHUV01051495.1.p1  ORF type:complete len:182 (+),score=46.06 GHUV01051495.1:438-983(+)